MFKLVVKLSKDSTIISSFVCEVSFAGALLWVHEKS